MKNILVILIVILGYSSVISAQTQNRIHRVENGGGVEVKENGNELKRKVAIGRFSNETQYGKGVFYNRENDPMAKQAQDLLASKLASSQKFLLLERSDMDKLQKEVEMNGGDVQQVGADYLIIGSITEFGRKTTGKSKVFNKTKTQLVEAKISIRIVDVYTGMIIFSDESSGEAELTTKTTMGFGGKAGYDATLSDKAISSAIDQMVENIIVKCTNKPWRSFFLTFDVNDGIFIAGGEAQGLQVGDSFLVMKKGKSVKNPQTGMFVELPGKPVGNIMITNLIAADIPENELSVVSYTGEEINPKNLTEYYIEEK